MDELGWIFPLIGALIGVFLGWFLSNRTQKNLLRVSEIRNELEKAYGPVYSIVNFGPEEMVKVDERTGTEERRVLVSTEEKKELDKILMSYPHMFPLKILVLFHTKIKNLQPVWVSPERGRVPMSYGIPVEFKNEIREEFRQRLEGYYKITGRWKSLKRLPKLARA